MAVQEPFDVHYEPYFPQIVARYRKVVSDLNDFSNSVKIRGFLPDHLNDQLSQHQKSFSLERFAQDVFNYIADIVKIPSRYIPRNIELQNIYIHGEDTITDVCHLAFYELVHYVTGFWGHFEKVVDIDSKVESVEAIVLFLEDFMMENFSSQGVISTARNFHTTLAFVVCLGIYLLNTGNYSGDLVDIFQRLPTAWLFYIKSNCLEEMERTGFFRILFEFSKIAVYNTSMITEYLGSSARWRKQGGLGRFAVYLVCEKKSMMKENEQPPVESKQSLTREELKRELREHIKLAKTFESFKETVKSIAIRCHNSPSPTLVEDNTLTVLAYQAILEQMCVLDEIVGPFIPTN